MIKVIRFDGNTVDPAYPASWVSIYDHQQFNVNLSDPRDFAVVGSSALGMRAYRSKSHEVAQLFPEYYFVALKTKAERLHEYDQIDNYVVVSLDLITPSKFVELLKNQRSSR